MIKIPSFLNKCDHKNYAMEENVVVKLFWNSFI